MKELKTLELDELLQHISTAQSTPLMRALDELARRGLEDHALLPVMCDTLGKHSSFEYRAPPPACVAFERIFGSNDKTTIAAILAAAGPKIGSVHLRWKKDEIPQRSPSVLSGRRKARLKHVLPFRDLDDRPRHHAPPHFDRSLPNQAWRCPPGQYVHSTSIPAVPGRFSNELMPAKNLVEPEL